MRVFALDAAMPFDFEHKAVQSLKKQRALDVAIIGFVKFGQFLAKRLIAAGHNVSSQSTTVDLFPMYPMSLKMELVSSW